MTTEACRVNNYLKLVENPLNNKWWNKQAFCKMPLQKAHHIWPFELQGWLINIKSWRYRITSMLRYTSQHIRWRLISRGYSCKSTIFWKKIIHKLLHIFNNILSPQLRTSRLCFIRPRWNTGHSRPNLKVYSKHVFCQLEYREFNHIRGKKKIDSKEGF